MNNNYSKTDRYSRQEILIGKYNQKRLQNKTACIIGVGGTGTAAAEHLARAGINLRLIDRDIVEESNLDRQILYSLNDVGEAKVIAAKKSLQIINPEIKIESFTEEVNPTKNAENLIVGDLIIDCTDNMVMRHLINEVSLKKGIPWIYSGAIKYEGMVAPFSPKGAPCFSCLYPTIPKPGSFPTCDSVGVLGPVAPVIGGIASTLAIQILIGDKEFGTLYRYNFEKKLGMETLTIKKNSVCEKCANKQFPILNGDLKIDFTKKLCGDSYQIYLKEKLDLKELETKLKKNPDVSILNKNAALVRFKYKQAELTVFKDGRTLIRNVKNEKEANSVYDKVIGR